MPKVVLPPAAPTAPDLIGVKAELAASTSALGLRSGFDPGQIAAFSGGYGLLDGVPAEVGARVTGLSLPQFWKSVASGRLPKPFYAAARAPRWRLAELLAALETLRALPAEAKEARRQAKLNNAR